jgi:hypothetical protein
VEGRGWGADRRERKEEGRVNMAEYFVCMHENRTMKPAEIVLRGDGVVVRMIMGVNLTGVHCMHV